MSNDKSLTMDEILNHLIEKLDKNNKKLSDYATKFLTTYNENRETIEQLKSLADLVTANNEMYLDEISRLKDEVIRVTGENNDLHNQISNQIKDSVMSSNVYTECPDCHEVSTDHEFEEASDQENDKINLAIETLVSAYNQGDIDERSYHQYHGLISHPKLSTRLSTANTIMERLGSKVSVSTFDTFKEDDELLNRVEEEQGEFTIPDEVVVDSTIINETKNNDKVESPVDTSDYNRGETPHVIHDDTFAFHFVDDEVK